MVGRVQVGKNRLHSCSGFRFSRLGWFIVSYREAPDAFASGAFSLYNPFMKHSAKISKKEPCYSFSLDERGEIVSDYSGNNKIIEWPSPAHLDTLDRSFPVVPGVASGAATDESYQVPNHPAFDEVFSMSELGPFSVEFWFNAEVDMVFYSRNLSIQYSPSTTLKISLVGNFSDLPEDTPRVLFDWPSPRGTHHLVLTNNNRNFDLFLNGILISSKDIQEIQDNLIFLGGPAGTPTGSLKGLVNSFSMYSRALSQHEIQENFLEGASKPDVSGVTRMFEGTVFPLGLDHKNSVQVWGLQESILQGDLVLEDAQVVTGAPTAIQMNSTSSRILVSIDQNILDGRMIFPVSSNNASFIFDGLEIENGDLYSAPEADTVEIEIKSATPSEPISDVRIYLYDGGIITSSGARTVSGDVARILDTRHPLEFSRGAGIYVYGDLKLTEVTTPAPITPTPAEAPEDVYGEWGEDNTVTDPNDANVPPGTSTPLPPAPVITPPATDPPQVYETITQTPLSSTSSTAKIRVVEVFCLGGDALTVSVGGASVTPTTYVNGVAATTTEIDEPSIIHFVLPADATTQEVVIGAPTGRQILGLATYPNTLTTSDISRVYARYSQTEIVNVDETNPILIEEASNTVENYSFAWSSTTAS